MPGGIPNTPYQLLVPPPPPPVGNEQREKGVSHPVANSAFASAEPAPSTDGTTPEIKEDPTCQGRKNSEEGHKEKEVGQSSPVAPRREEKKGVESPPKDKRHQKLLPQGHQNVFGWTGSFVSSPLLGVALFSGVCSFECLSPNFVGRDMCSSMVSLHFRFSPFCLISRNTTGYITVVFRTKLNNRSAEEGKI